MKRLLKKDKGNKPTQHRTMPHLLVLRATYIDERDLSDFLVGIFGDGACTVKWKTGRFQCTLPRPLTDSERAELDATVPRHYSRY
ncbi:hypothetical protein V8F20_005073 [Naviculisporaceae sp. PSN 640]